MTKHGCGHCGEKFEDSETLREHVSDCDVIACTICDKRFDNRLDKWDHDCPEASDEPFVDPEGQFRAERRKKKRQRAWEEKMQKERHVW